MSDKLPEYNPIDWDKYLEKQKSLAVKEYEKYRGEPELQYWATENKIRYLRSKMEFLKQCNAPDWIKFNRLIKELRINLYYIKVHAKKFNWLLLFKDIDINTDFVPETQAHVLNTLEDKENFYSASVFNLTFQMLYNFKSNVYFHSNETKLKYIDDHFKDEPLQKNSERDFKVTEASIYQAKLNFKHFLECYKAELLNTVKPEQPEKETEQETPTFTNNFDKIKPTEIYKHFKAGLVEKGYLTEQELNEYLKTAFEMKKIPETLFKIKDAPKKKVIEAVFYQYYKYVAGKVHGKQSEYAALLGNYFEGYKTTNVSSNFSKSEY